MEWAIQVDHAALTSLGCERVKGPWRSANNLYRAAIASHRYAFLPIRTFNGGQYWKFFWFSMCVWLNLPLGSE